MRSQQMLAPTRSPAIQQRKALMCKASRRLAVSMTASAWRSASRARSSTLNVPNSMNK